MTYHDTSIASLNALVRKYNGLAPYVVRRAYYQRERELERVYEVCGAEIVRGWADEIRKAGRETGRTEGGGEEEDGGAGGGLTREKEVEGLGRRIWRYVRSALGLG